MSLTGIFGGTFDPVHLGHLHILEQLKMQLQFNSIHFIPAHIPPHKPLPHASSKQRLEMIKLAISDQPDYVIDNREFNRTTSSWTIDTLLSLRQELPQQHLGLILGLDALLGFESWHRWQEILDLTHIIIIHRPGFNKPKPLPAWWQRASTSKLEKLQQQQSGTIVEIDIDSIPISATAIRIAIKNNQTVRHLLPEAVWQYIVAQKLYYEDAA